MAKFFNLTYFIRFQAKNLQSPSLHSGTAVTDSDPKAMQRLRFKTVVHSFLSYPTLAPTSCNKPSAIKLKSKLRVALNPEPYEWYSNTLASTPRRWNRFFVKLFYSSSFSPSSISCGKTIQNMHTG